VTDSLFSVGTDTFFSLSGSGRGGAGDADTFSFAAHFFAALSDCRFLTAPPPIVFWSNWGIMKEAANNEEMGTEETVTEETATSM